MYTRCPSCESVYPLQARNLAEAAGVVRCGHCGKTFNALSHLFEDHPEANQPALKGGGVPPLLEHASIAQRELPGVSLDHEERVSPGPALNFELAAPAEQTQQANRLWMLACVALLTVLLTQLLLQWRDPDSRLRLWSDASGQTARPVAAADVVQIISRDMHRHPTLDDAIVISATLRNPSQQTVAWPVLEVRLYDASQQVLGARRLEPAHYLVASTAVERGMAPDLVVPVIMEFVVGSTEPSGFDFRFY
jgi:predicted Zn finger-like uncharacterized protein